MYVMNSIRDKLVPIRLAEEMHARIPGSKLVLFQGGHLFFQLRERDRFRQELEAALS